jgi:1,2-diacylglycerol 3-beta-galactosyltransferase
MKKILILMARFGGGHEAIAEAMKDAIDQYGESNYQVVIEDGFPPIFEVSQSYGTFPFLFDQGYKLTNNDNIAKIIHATNTMLIGRHIRKVIRRHMPDLIISNHPLLTSEVKSVLKKIKKRIIFSIYFADAFYLHKFWYTEKQADFYLTPTHDSYSYALKNGIPANQMHYVGWLLRKKFYDLDFDKKMIKKNLGFNENKFLVYLSGGGDGYGKLEEIVKGLLDNKFFVQNCQLVVVCGVNHKLLIKLQKIQRKMTASLSSLGYINNVVDYKKAADIVCSKAGPNDIFESIMLQKPFFAHNYFWVHEGDNFKWLKKQNIGFADRNPQRMVAKIISCLKNPQLLREKVENVIKIRAEHVNAPKVLVEKIEEILQ